MNCFVRYMGQIKMRPSKNEIFMEIAYTLSKRSTCLRRRVGCVLVNQYNHIISTGYNGVGAGLAHCLDQPCAGASLPSGTGLDKCEAIHAEQNALLQCPNVQDIWAAYVTVSPCMHCAKLFMNTGVQTIIYNEVYDPDVLKYIQENSNIVLYALKV